MFEFLKECKIESSTLRESIQMLEQKIDELNAKIHKKNSEIFELNKNIKELNLKALEVNKAKGLEKKQKDIENEKDKILKSKNEINNKYQKLSSEINKLKKDLMCLNDEYNKVNIDKETYLEEKKKLEGYIVDKNNEIVLLLQEKEKLVNQVKDFGLKKDKLCSDENIKQEINKLKEKSNAIIKEKESLFVELEETTKEKLKINNLLKSKIKELEDQINEIKIELDKELPYCDKCNVKMRLKEGTYGLFFGCPNFSFKKCENTIGIPFIVNERFIKLNGDKKNLERDLNSDKRNQERNYLQKDNNDFSKKNENHYISLNDFNDTLKTYLFDSITVPKDLFKERINFKKYSKFKVTTNLNRSYSNNDHGFIYTLVLRLLTRGIVLPINSSIDEAMNDKFNISKISMVEEIFSSIKYIEPFYQYDSIKEKEFAEAVFPKLFKGKSNSWASYVYTQVPFDFICPNNENVFEFKKQRVDFFVCHNNRKCVIEIDGKEHLESQQSAYDKKRDEFLEKQCDCKVFRFSNTEVDAIKNNNYFLNTKEKLNSLFLFINEEKIDQKYIEYDIKYTMAIKIFHQLEISMCMLLEKGYIKSLNGILLESNNTVFDSDELNFILEFAKSDLIELIDKYCKIYSIRPMLDEASKDQIRIYYGDGNSNEKSVLIRDISLDYNYLYELNPITSTIFPSNIMIEDIDYFLKYVFDYDEFREGQFEAIKRLLLRKDSIILLPTGAGKSIIYQLSSYIVPGVIIVVSPLKSLIDDQLVNLEDKFGITNVIGIHSGLDGEKKQNITHISNSNISMFVHIT